MQSDFFGQNSTIYMRVPFTVADPAGVTSLAFSARYDDGFAIYINGSGVLASANPPNDGVLDWEANPSGSHSDSLAVALEPFAIDLGEVALVAGTNVLAIHGMNRGASSSDFLFDCELDAEIIQTGGGVELVYMATPTPGAENGDGVPDLGPVIRHVTENPPRPGLATETDIHISAEVTPTQDPLTSVTLKHRQGFGVEGLDRDAG